MKKLFYLSLVLLLCVSCSKEDVFPEQEEMDNSDVVETRVAVGHISMELLGNTATVKWNKPFGDGRGIQLLMYDAKKPSVGLGYVYACSDAGETRTTIPISSNDMAALRDLNLKAKVNSCTCMSNGNIIVGDEGREVQALNKNNPLIYPCTHAFLPASEAGKLGINLSDGWSMLTLNRYAVNPLLIVVKASYEKMVGTSINHSPVFDTVTDACYANVQDYWDKHRGSNWGKVEMGSLRHIVDFAFRNSVRFEIRLYDTSCPKFMHYFVDGFPSCPTYYKYEFSLTPGQFFDSTVNMTLVKK